MMKKEYIKPYVEVEVYMLDAAIALNCDPIVNLGPQALDIAPCEYFKDKFEPDAISTFSLEKPFYADGSANCDCYYQSGGKGYFTS